MPHLEHDIFENRKQFQIERMILFSDAVFAIAITLLIIEIKIPELDGKTSLWTLLGERWTDFFGLALSFVIIGQFWTNHHRLFGYVNNYTNTLLWLNLHMLFWIIVMPFSSALSSRYAGYDSVWMLYCFNLFMIATSIYFLWRYITNPKRDISQIAHNAAVRQMAKVRSLTVALIFLSGDVLCMFNRLTTSYMARFVFLLIIPAVIIIKRIYAKKITPHDRGAKL